MKTVIEIKDFTYPIKVEQSEGRGLRFRVTYGKQVTDRLTYGEAAKELGYAMFHALACEGKLDNQGE